MCLDEEDARGQGPFTARNWLSSSGPIIGILNRDLLHDSLDKDGDCPILVVVPDTWEWIPSSTGTSQGPDSTNSTMGSAPSTPSKPSNSKYVQSRNPFLSPSKPRPLLSPTVQGEQNLPTSDSNNVPTVSQVLSQPAQLDTAIQSEKNPLDSTDVTQLSQFS